MRSGYRLLLGRLLLATGILVWISPLTCVDALAQSATTRTVQSRSTPDIASMQKQIDELRARITELEKEKMEAFEADKADDAQDKALAQRIAALEKARNKDADEAPSKGSTHDSKPKALTVRAPLIVVDEDGEVVFKADRSPTSQAARVVVGDEGTAQIVLGATTKGDAQLVMFAPDGTVRGSFYSSEKRSSLSIGESGKGRAVMSVEGAESKVEVINASDMPVSILSSSKAGYGKLEIADAAGNNMVEAGTAGSVGVVRTGPRMGGPPSGLAMPTTLMGKK